jgi:hypothetical protein
MRPFLIATHGLAGSGKTTTTNYIVSTYNALEYAMARPLKKLCGDLFKLTPEEMEDHKLKETFIPRLNCTPRYILKHIGTELFRDRLKDAAPALPYGSIWLDLGREWLQEHEEQNQVVSDARFVNEIDMIHSIGGIVIGIDRSEEQESGPGLGKSWYTRLYEYVCGPTTHASEQTCFEKCDVVIRNTGTIEELQSKIDEFLLSRGITIPSPKLSRH